MYVLFTLNIFSTMILMILFNNRKNSCACLINIKHFQILYEESTQKSVQGCKMYTIKNKIDFKKAEDILLYFMCTKIYVFSL